MSVVRALFANYSVYYPKPLTIMYIFFFFLVLCFDFDLIEYSLNRDKNLKGLNHFNLETSTLFKLKTFKIK